MTHCTQARVFAAPWSTLAVAALAATLAVTQLGGCASANARANATAFSRDTTVTARVKAELLRTAAVSGTDVKVDSQGGVVTLSGQVGSADQSVAAAEVARNVEGVDGVINALRVATP
ncbi:BON domain-containing protein [Chitinasiproducens palmae]|uniref:Hyperosmotically inducible protein n=1 Tax=Chitinasiproducens palmae TaxID=1770053 RepID=A0A1H2PUU3_9BURK|nr:BON domain-containing protein [Chitinasiproducens palmae]SDV50999.1 hyperosmotically inducible protein [Chitinasiproducens palmae]